MTKKQKEIIQNTLRWIALLPALYITWVVGIYVAIPLGLFLTGEYTDFVQQSALVGMLFVVPGIAMFFVAKFIAPRYKNITGISAIVLCGLLAYWFVITMAQSY